MLKLSNYFKNKSDIILMESKRILKFEGKDTVKFLNNICTSNIINLNKFSPTLFLDAKGKILTKANIFKSNIDNINNEIFYIEIENRFSNELINSISKFAFKKDVKIYDENSDVVLLLVKKSNLQINEDVIIKIDYLDNEFSNILMKKSNNEIYSKLMNNSQNEKVELLKQEIIYGIPDHNTVHNKFPSFFNFDLMNYIDYKKGCYLGQELTQRTKFSNSTNKRMFVYEISKINGNNYNKSNDVYIDLNSDVKIDIKSKDLNIYNDNDKVVGSIVKEYNPIPFISAFIVKDYFSSKHSFHIKNDKNDKIILENIYKPNI